MPSEQSICLYMTEGASDKEYRVQLKRSPNGDDGWLVDFQNGRRGKPLRHGTKTPESITFEAAKKIYDSLVRQKTSKGYTEHEDGRTFQDLPNGKEHSGVRLQLLEEVDCEDAASLERLFADPNWALEQKHDGERRALVMKLDESQQTAICQGANLEGFVVPLSTEVVEAMRMMSHQYVLDGEDMGSHIVIFDVVTHMMHPNLSDQPYDYRRQVLEDMMAQLPAGTPLVLNQVAWSEQDKRALYTRVKECNQEGLVFKNVHAPYEAGRNGNQIKVKFRADATCLVLARNPGKNSVAIGVADTNGQPVGVGNVTVPASHRPLEPGELIDVRYLYAYPGGSLFQPVFKGVRTDKSAPDARDRLKYRGEDMIVSLPGTCPGRDASRPRA